MVLRSRPQQQFRFGRAVCRLCWLTSVKSDIPKRKACGGGKCYAESMSAPEKLENICLATVGIHATTLGILAQCSTNADLRDQFVSNGHS